MCNQSRGRWFWQCFCSYGSTGKKQGCYTHTACKPGAGTGQLQMKTSASANPGTALVSWCEIFSQNPKCKLCEAQELADSVLHVCPLCSCTAWSEAGGQEQALRETISPPKSTHILFGAGLMTPNWGHEGGKYRLTVTTDIHFTVHPCAHYVHHV